MIYVRQPLYCVACFACDTGSRPIIKNIESTDKLCTFDKIRQQKTECRQRHSVFLLLRCTIRYNVPDKRVAYQSNRISFFFSLSCFLPSSSSSAFAFSSCHATWLYEVPPRELRFFTQVSGRMASLMSASSTSPPLQCFSATASHYSNSISSLTFL